ncbi:hypothetical protein PCA20602_02121 [Pandoraea capi]|uniref:Uncharacterized protein n=1 Tax=Pandoraea capi TaxID=2508286 RepID=A0ABY6VXH0_9BURK|nr:hypothetical protein PCA20602_02121 [Pandoraea capi]
MRTHNGRRDKAVRGCTAPSQARGSLNRPISGDELDGGVSEMAPSGGVGDASPIPPTDTRDYMAGGC